MTTSAPNWLKTPGPHKLSGKQLAGIVATLVLFAALWLAAMSSYSDQPAVTAAAPISAEEGLQITARASTYNTAGEDLAYFCKLKLSAV